MQLDPYKSTGTAQLIDSPDTVCGTVDIADNHTSASGTFVATVDE